MEQVYEFFDPFTWEKLALVFCGVLLPIVLWRLLRSKSGGVWFAKWDDRIEAVAQDISAASNDMNALTIRIAQSRIVELEIAAKLMPHQDHREALQREVRDLQAIIEQTKNRR